MSRFSPLVAVGLALCCDAALSAAAEPSYDGSHAAAIARSAGPEPGEAEYLRSHDHRRQAPGAPFAPEKAAAKKHKEAQEKSLAQGRYTAETDRAWTVMLVKQGIVSKQVGAKVLKALENIPAGGEDALKKRLKDEDLASVVNYGRTLQEPMSRMILRDKLLDVMDATLGALRATLDVADANDDTIKPVQPHHTHAPPHTYAAYLLAVYGNLARGLEHLELAYRHANECTAGCGATSGTGWPVDRQLVSDLLGFDRLMEPTYECEGAQDYALSTLFATSHVMTTLSRSAMDHNIWASEDVAMMHVTGPWQGTSSLMPQKAIMGSSFERTRIDANNVFGDMLSGLVALKGEPLGDMLPIYTAWHRAGPALCEAEKSLTLFAALLRAVVPDRPRMLQMTCDGFSGTPDLAVKLIRDKGYGGRRAHRICAVFVRLARQRGLRPYETTGELLDEAARTADETPPGLSTAEVREMLDPEKFIQRHNNVGDPHPDESRRMLALRRTTLAEAEQRQAKRRTQLEEADRRLSAEIQAILGQE